MSFGRRPLGRESGGESLQLLAYGEQVANRGVVERRHHRTATGQDLDEAFGLHHTQRLAHRIARHPEVVREPGLGQPLALRVITVDDPPAQFREYLLA